MPLPRITGEFRIIGEPELKFTPAGKALMKFRAVANSRRKDDSGQWVNDKECWVNVTAWERLAENAMESLTDKALVFIDGTIETRSYETQAGEKRTSFDVTATALAPSLSFATAKVIESSNKGGGAGSSGGGQRSAPAQDPWGAQTPAQDPWGAPASDEPPF